MKGKLSLTQEQKLHQSLSPLQVQYVRLLEMNDSELEEEVRRELDENPALESVDDADHDISRTDEDDFSESAEELQLADYRNEDEIPGYRLSLPSEKNSERYFEPHASESDTTLMEWLMNQLLQTKMSEKEIEIARYIIGDIDDNGYMTRSLRAIEDDVVITGGIDATTEEMKSVWEKIRSLDPAGIGAVDLRDCLLLQLKRKVGVEADNKALDDALEIITHYFDLFSSMKFERLQSATGMSLDRIKAAIEEIKTLNPKPGAAFSGAGEAELRASHIIPDFIVEAEGDNLVLTIPNSIPSLQIEQTFAEANVIVPAKSSRAENDVRTFIRTKREEAHEFIKALEMRRETLLRVMTAIMKFQRDFFLTDDELKLKPMILKDVAEATGYDISVVSRATSGKYVATNNGIYSLKFFFNERPKEDSDASHIEILTKIKEIIDNEDKEKPLTDEALMDKMKEAGYDIARRTISKYREKAGIPVARLRKQI
ncbi:MAG: RNA polymerase factor sigma-54 [Paramuribaculum sp.]|nr:RNA polymerase factor sigma-54 [Paramuribaculum sp.]